MAADAYPQAAYCITLDGEDLTARMQGRLQRLTITDKRGLEADELDLTVSDHDGRLGIPRRGVALQVAIGWQDTGVVDRGTYVVDEVEHSGPPDVITIRARSADLRGPMKSKRTQSWHDVTVGEIVQTIAERHGLAARVGDDLAARAIDHEDQTDESDVAFLTRLAERFDAVATVKAGRLLFIPAGGARTASGEAIPAVHIPRSAGDSHRYSVTDRDRYSGVRAYWQDIEGAERREVVVGRGDELKTLRRTHATQSAAEAAAKAEWARIQRGAAALSLTLAAGQPALYPETPATVSGYKAAIDARDWLITEVRHRLDSSGGYTSSLECETSRE